MNTQEFNDKFEEILKEEWTTLKQEEGKRLSTEFRNELVKRILLQRFPWPPLSSGYAAWKKSKALDPRTLIARRDYVKSIQTRKVDDDTWVVEPPDRQHYSGLTYKMLAMVHEFGSSKRNIPPRPHWRPMIAEYQKKQPAINKVMRRKLYTRVQERLGKEITPNF